MQIVVRVLLTIILVSVAGFLSYEMGYYYLYSPWTRDARVRADVVPVAPDVSGYVDEVRVRNDQFVHKGDILLVIDQDRYRIALADAEAALATRRAQHQMSLRQYERRKKLTTGLSITIEDLDNAYHNSDAAAGNYQQATAARDLAALNLKRTEVRASVNGYITNLNLAPGTYAVQGKPVLALIDSDSYRVEAYFEETKIPHIRPGSVADIHLMDGSPTLHGTVIGIARGITDQDNKDGPELLSSVNPTYTWVRLAQRIPVRIQLTDVPAGVLISAGMTCTVIVQDGMQARFGSSIKDLISRAARLVQTTVARGDGR
jgi:multidrug resistance efflux pump